MTNKSKKIVWHKKSGKLIPAKFLKSQNNPRKDQPSPLEPSIIRKQNRMKFFSQKLAEEIRKAL